MLRKLSYVTLGVVLAAANLSLAADPHSPLAHVSKDAVYPVGSALAQTYSHPADLPSLATLSAAPGTISITAAAMVMNALPDAESRNEAGLSTDLRMAVRVPIAAADAANAAPTSVYLFEYGMTFKDVPLARTSSQAIAARVRGNARDVIFVRDRNVPSLEALAALGELNELPDAAEGAEATAMKHARQILPEGELVVERESSPPHLEILTNPAGQARLTWAIIIRSADPVHAFAFRYWISAKDVEQIESSESLVYHVEGRVTGSYWAQDKSPFQPPLQGQPVSSCYVGLDQGSRVVCDVDGKYVLQGPPTLKDLSGPFCRVENRGGAPFLGTVSGNDLAFSANGEFQIAQVTAFQWTNAARAFVNAALPNQPDLLDEVPTRVNINDHCNAFWNGVSLNFFRGGDGCPNTAYASVVFHEYGHGVDDQLGGIHDGGYSEGFGDALSILITRSNIVGADFFGPGEHLRNAADVVNWPPTDPEVHEVGRIYGGFVWQLTRELLQQYSNDPEKAFGVAKGLVLGAAALDPRNIPDAVALSFLVDRQATNGAHFDALAKAADSRHIPRPASVDHAANLVETAAAK